MSVREHNVVPALALRNVRKDFGALTILRDVSLQLQQGERLALIGPNGAGKSTLFNLISGRLAPQGGEISLLGQDIAGRKPYEINRLGLARSFQITHLFPRLSVLDNLRCAVMWSHGGGYSFWQRLSRLTAVRARAEEVMQQIGLEARRDVAAGELTYAEQRALEIGVTVAGGAEVILLDEPTAGMSRAESDAAIALIRHATQGRALLMVEHDMSVVFGLADRIAVLAQGELIACDTPGRIRADPRVRQAYLGDLALEEGR